MDKLLMHLDILIKNFASNLSDYINEITEDDNVDSCFNYVENTVMHLLKDYRKFAKKIKNNTSDNEGTTKL